jgi:hypothetical protein
LGIPLNTHLIEKSSGNESVERSTNGSDHHVATDANTASLEDEPFANAEYLNEPKKKVKKRRGATRALIMSKRGVPNKDSYNDIIMGEPEAEDGDARKRKSSNQKTK